MFEKEAYEFQKQIQQEYLDLGKNGAYPPLWERIGELWGKGAEFGYNKAKEEMVQNGLALQSDMDKTIEQNIALKKELEKANEWNYPSKGELPTDDKDMLMSKTLLLITKMKGSDCLSLALGEYNFSTQEFSYQHIVGLTDVIAWKEIVLPELKESEQ